MGPLAGLTTSRAIGCATLLFAFAVSMPAQGRALSGSDDDDDETEQENDSLSESTPESATDAQAGVAEGNSRAGAEDAEKPALPAGEHAWSVGPYVRYVVVPSFMLELFTDLAPSATNPAFGVTARYRTKPGGPIFDMGVGYGSYAFQGAFRSKGGVENDTEWVESNLALIYLTGSILWETDISKQFAFEYGVGLDIGIVTGQLKRTEAYLGGNGQYGKCMGINQPPNNYCMPPLTGGSSDPYTVKGEQYNVVDQSVPGVMALPMLPRLGLRFSPTPEVAVRLEASYGIAQMWVGLSAAYTP